jgi:hypothetical protein
LWCDVDTSSVVPQALAFDRQVFDVLVRRRFHDQSRSEHATLDDLRGVAAETILSPRTHPVPVFFAALVWPGTIREGMMERLSTGTATRRNLVKFTGETRA